MAHQAHQRLLTVLASPHTPFLITAEVSLLHWNNLRLLHVNSASTAKAFSSHPFPRGKKRKKKSSVGAARTSRSSYPTELQKEPRARGQALMRARVSSATGSRFGVWGFTALQTKQRRCLFALITSDSPHLPVTRSLSVKSDCRQWTLPGFRHAAPQAWGGFSWSPCPSKRVGMERNLGETQEHPRIGRVTWKCNTASLL